MKYNRTRITLYGCLILLLAACNGVGAPTQSDETLALPASHPTAAAMQTESEVTQPIPSSGMESLIEQAKEDLAQRLSIPVAQISLVEAREVVWPDSSLGCPQPETVYTQVLSSGLLIHLETGGKVYEYHTNFNEQVILCEPPRAPLFPVKPGDIQDGQPWMPP
jgi:hypothetical protein